MGDQQWPVIRRGASTVTNRMPHSQRFCSKWRKLISSLCSISRFRFRGWSH